MTSHPRRQSPSSPLASPSETRWFCCSQTRRADALSQSWTGGTIWIRGHLSVSTPLGKAVLGAEEGDEIVFRLDDGRERKALIESAEKGPRVADDRNWEGSRKCGAGMKEFFRVARFQKQSRLILPRRCTCAARVGSRGNRVCCSACWLAGLSAWWLNLNYLHRSSRSDSGFLTCFSQVFVTPGSAPAILRRSGSWQSTAMVVLRWRRTLGKTAEQVSEYSTNVRCWDRA